MAAFLYLRRNPGAVTHRLLIPLTLRRPSCCSAWLLLIGINIELLTFADALTNTILILVTPLVFSAGLLAARWGAHATGRKPSPRLEALKPTNPDLIILAGTIHTIGPASQPPAPPRRPWPSGTA